MSFVQHSSAGLPLHKTSIDTKGSPDLEVQSETKTGDAAPVHDGLQRHLKARHVSMIALGGALGTGLIIGTGSGLARGGPASILICYALVGLVVYLVLGACGEMATYIPMASGFTGYSSRYVDPAMGFAVGYW